MNDREQRAVNAMTGALLALFATDKDLRVSPAFAQRKRDEAWDELVAAIRLFDPGFDFWAYRRLARVQLGFESPNPLRGGA